MNWFLNYVDGVLSCDSYAKPNTVYTSSYNTLMKAVGDKKARYSCPVDSQERGQSIVDGYYEMLEWEKNLKKDPMYKAYKKKQAQ